MNQQIKRIYARPAAVLGILSSPARIKDTRTRHPKLYQSRALCVSTKETIKNDDLPFFIPESVVALPERGEGLLVQE